MKEQEIERQLVAVIQKLEEAADRIVQTNGYTAEVKKSRLLAELIKEQIRNENSLSAARSLR